MSYRIGWFSTGRGSGSEGLLRAMVAATHSGYAPAEIAFVFTNREAGEGEGSDRFMALVRNYGIPLIPLSYRDFKARYGKATDSPDALPGWRLDYDREVMRRLADYAVDISVLAGYMLLAGPELCTRHNLLNLHPAAPGGPAGTWTDVIRQLILTGAENSGVMMHLASPEMDAGPVVSYATFPIRGVARDALWAGISGKSEATIRALNEQNPLFARIRTQGVVRERPLVTATVKAFAEGRVRITPRQEVVDAAGQALRGYDLSAEIDKLIGDAA